MLDFVSIKVAKGKRKDEIIVAPFFSVKRSTDLITRGKSFLAFWDEKTGLWNKNEFDFIDTVDEEIRAKCEKYREDKGSDLTIIPLYLSEFSSNKWNEWLKFVKGIPDNDHELDSKITFANTEVKKSDYVSKRLSYPIAEGPHDAYDELMNTLYSPAERDKLEWAIGSIIAGDSKKIQKFIVLYGDAGTGKSTVIKIITDMLFPGYCCTFYSQELTGSNNTFALEAFKDNPLVAFQNDGKLNKIEDNTKLNSLVSHEIILMNEKHKSQYPMRINSFIFIGSNSPVKITDSKSGLMRRLIDVSPTGNTIPRARYDSLMNQIQFELGAIADHCLKKYQKMGKGYYDKYRPNQMIEATNDFYNFISDNYEFFSDEEGVTLSAAWAEYKKYAEEANLYNKYSLRVFKEELKSYFSSFEERSKGRYKVYLGFKKEKFDYVACKEKEKEESVEGCEYTLKLDCSESIFDKEFAEYPAQLAKDDESPCFSWTNVKTLLKDIDTKKLHYLLGPENLIVIDFDLRDEKGNKDPIANLMAASKYPATYAEFSKSGGGVHLYYIFDGDVLTLSNVIEPGVEVKVYKKQDGTRGYASIRRKLSKCNNLPVAHINSGLPIKKGKRDVTNFEGLKNEKGLRTLIMRALRKEYHGFTAPNVDLIYTALEKAYADGITYDVTDLRSDVLQFAAGSHNQAGRCIEKVAKMKFKSAEDFVSMPDEEYERYAKASGMVASVGAVNAGVDVFDNTIPIIFFDVEVFPNLFIICWKFTGGGKSSVIRMINPSSEEIKELFKYRLVGFNNRRYDNHIVYAGSLGYTTKHLYEISRGIINSDKKEGGRQHTFGAAYSLSYTDIYDFSSKKQSLKKWEIELKKKNPELDFGHEELGLPWDEPVPEELWDKVADYCVNDVMATEALFYHLKEDFTAREILADLAGRSVNDTTNTLTTKIVFGNDEKPELVYTDLATGNRTDGGKSGDNGIIGAFPGYEYVKLEDGKFHNMYRGVDVGKGGYVYAEPGMYTNVALLDVASMHPTSIIRLNKLGKYTERYADLRKARVLIKHGDYEEAGKLFDGKLKKYLTDPSSAKALSKALKIPLNSFYGISCASFKNPARDPRDNNNIIALRGALFMKTLQDEVAAKGYTVVHIKTDSIKIADATEEIIQFVMDFGKKYGYEFEHEATYQKICLVNDAVYIAKYDEHGENGEHGNEWTATGAQFQQPVVFKTLFSKEPIIHDDMCETKETSKGLGLYLDMNEHLPDGEHNHVFIGKVGRFCPIKSEVQLETTIHIL